MTCLHVCDSALCRRRDRLGRAAMIALMLAWPGVTLAKVRVVTTTPSLADITRQVGGDHVKVMSVMRGPENVHNVSPRPSQMMKLRKADLFIHSGLDMELWAPLLVKGARNRKLLPGQPGNLDASRGIELKQVPKAGQLSRALGDIHVYGNPHYALDPLNGIIIARTITEALKRADPSHAAEFDANNERFAAKIRNLTTRLTEQMAPYAGTRVVTYHRTWPYFLDRFGLVSIGEVEPKPGITPGPQHLSECIRRMKAAHARIVMVETFNSLEVAGDVADRAGGRAVVLGAEVNALPEVKTYEALFEYNVGALLQAIHKMGITPNVEPPGSAAAGTRRR